MSTPQKNFIAVDQETGATYRFNDTDWEGKKDRFMELHPNANIVEYDAYNPDDVQDTDNIYVTTKKGAYSFTPSEWTEKQGRFMEVNKDNDVQVGRLRGVDYYYDQAKADEEEIANLKKRIEGHPFRGLPEEATLNPYRFEPEGLTDEEQVQYRKDKKDWERTIEQIGTIPELEAKLKETQDRFDRNPRVVAARKQYEEEVASYLKNYNNGLIDEANKIIEANKDAVHARANRQAYKGGGAALGGSRGAMATFSKYDNDRPKIEDAGKIELYEKAGAAKRMLQDAQDLRAGKLKGFWKGVGDTFENIIEDYTFQSNTKTYAQVAMILNDLNKSIGNLNDLTPEDIDKSLSPIDALLLKSYFELASAQEEASPDWKYQAGEIGGTSVLLGLEMLALGGFSKGTASLATKGLTRALEKWVAKGVGKKLVRKGIAKTVDLATRGTLNAGILTALSPSTYETIAGNLPTIDENGNVDLLSNAGVGVWDAFSEKVSELSGGYIGKVLGVPFKPVKGLAAKGWNKAFGGTKFGEWGKALANGATSDYLKAAGFHGMPIEMLEEVVGNAMRLPINPDAMSEMFEAENMGAMALGFLPMTVLGGGISVAQLGAASKAATRSASNLRNMLIGKGYSEGRADFLTDVKREMSATELGLEMLEMKEELKKKGATEEELKLVSDYVTSVAEYQTIRGGMEEVQTKEKEQIATELEGQYGQFYRANNEGAKEVEMAVTNDGRAIYITTDKSASGEYGAIDQATGATIFVNDSDIKARETISLDGYLDNEMQARREIAEAERMENERNEQIAKLSQILPSKLNIGTQGEPQMVVVKGQSSKGVTVVINEAGDEAILDWDTVGQKMGMPIKVLSDAQIADAEAEAIGLDRATKRAQRAKTKVDIDSVQRDVSDINERIKKNTPAPEEAYRNQETGEIDENAFWENDPEGWADYNDRTMQDGGIDTMDQIDNGLALLNQQMAQLNKMATDSPNARKAVKAQKAQLQEKIDRLTALQQKYVDASIAAEQQREKTEEEKAELTIALRERVAEWRRRLGLNEEQLVIFESKEDILNSPYLTEKDKKDVLRVIDRGKTEGWYNTASTRAFVFLPDIKSEEDLDRTIAHEVVTHYGLHNLIGEKAYNELMDKVWNTMSDAAKNTYYNYPGVSNEKDADKRRRMAAEEFVAHVAESISLDEATAEQKSIWKRIVDFFRNLFKGSKFTDKDIADIVRKNYQQLTEQAAQESVEEFKAEAQEQAERNAAEEVAETEGNAVIDSNDNQQAEGNVLFKSTNGSLVGMHNISEDKLRKVLKQGGLANPSTAVVNIAEYLLDGFGDISLIMPSSLVDANTGDNIGTYTGDAWTPTYPPISRKVDNKGWKVIKDLIRSVVSEDSPLYHDIINGLENYLEDNRSSKMEFVFLKKKGIEPEIAYKGADGFVGMRNLEAVLGVQGLRDGLESYERYKNASPMAKRSFNMWLDAAGNKQAHKELKEQIKKEPKLAEVLKLNEDVSFAEFDSFTYDIFRKEQDAGKIDTYDTMGAAARYVDANNLRGEFEAWLESLMEQAEAKEVFFAGYTRDGDRIYKDNTLENVSRYMRLQGRTNAYDDHGLSATKSALLQRLTSLSQIRKNKARLQNESAYNKEYDALKDRLWSIISQLADMQEISSNQFMNVDYAESRLQESLTKKNPIAHLNKEYGYDIDPAGEYADELNSFIKDVQQMPAKYFETKFERPVYLNEFAAAVMPTTTSEDIKQAVSEAGLPIFEYDSAVEGSRKEATLKATEGEGIRFRTHGEKGAANLDKAEEATIRLDNLGVARQMEEAGKDAKAIKLATGWERGADNLWRYEVADDFDLAELENRLQENLNDGLSKTWGVLYPSDLGDLTKAYPDFNVDIMVWVGDEFENTGEYSPATEGDETTFGRPASIEVKAKTVADIKDVLVHEIQHAIQEKEGFAEGGSVFGLKDKLSAELDKRVARIKELRAEGRDAEADELMRMSKGLGEAVINNDADTYQNYRKLAGEVEARNISARLGMSEEERRGSLLSETEDVAREDQIVLMDGLDMHSVPVTEEMKESVMEGQVMFSTLTQSETDAMNAKQTKVPGGLISDEQLETSNILFSISKNNRATIEKWLGMRNDLTQKEKDAFMLYIDNREPVQQLAMARWFAKGSIRLPEDLTAIDDAFKLARKMNADPMKYDTPAAVNKDYVGRFGEENEENDKRELLSPDDARFNGILTNKVDYGNGIVVYDVQNDIEHGQRAVRDLMNDHLGTEFNCWCLLYADSKGNPTRNSEDMWWHYNKTQKKVAFKDGKICAFCASTGQASEWWDLHDQSHKRAIPVEVKVEGDKLGRSAICEFDGKTIRLVKNSPMYRGNKKNGIYEEWENSNPKSITLRTTRKGGKDDGVMETWDGKGNPLTIGRYKKGKKVGEHIEYTSEGQITRKSSYDQNGEKHGDYLVYSPKGQLLISDHFNHGTPNGELVTYSEKGQLLHSATYDNGFKIGYETGYNEKGKLTSKKYHNTYKEGTKTIIVTHEGGPDGKIIGYQKRTTSFEEAEEYMHIREDYKGSWFSKPSNLVSIKSGDIKIAYSEKYGLEEYGDEQIKADLYNPDYIVVRYNGSEYVFNNGGKFIAYNGSDEKSVLKEHAQESKEVWAKVKDIEQNARSIADGMMSNVLSSIKEPKPIETDSEGQTMFKTKHPLESPSTFMRSVVDEFYNRYNTMAPAHVVYAKNRRMVAEAFGLSADELADDVYQRIKDEAKVSDGMYVELDVKSKGDAAETRKRILIFVNPEKNMTAKVDAISFHENIHGMVRENEDLLKLGEWLLSHDENDIVSDIVNDTKAHYEESVWAEEVLCDYVGNMMALGRSQEALNVVPDEYKPLLNSIYEKFGYRPEVEDSARESERNDDARRIRDLRISEELQMRNSGNVEGTTDGNYFKTEITPEVRKEMDVISATAIVNGNYMKAPNGKDSKLTPEQWAMVRTKNFKRWFGDWENDPANASKVVDPETGEPKEVYHGTAGVINKFEGQQRSPGFWFVDREDVANGYAESASEEFGEEKNVIPVFLNIRKPRVEDAHSEYPAEFTLKSYVENDNGVYEVFDTYEEAEAYRKANVPDGWVGAAEVGDQHDLVERAKELGHDGVIMMNMYDQAAYAETEVKGTQTNYVVLDANQIKSATDNTGEFSEDADIRFKTVTDPAKIAELEASPKIKVYRAMQLIDGKLYPPMSAKVDGELRQPIELGQWEEAEERPDLVDEKGRFKLDKGNKASVPARYNPYFHTSRTPLNDQFSSAQTRPNLVTVEVEIPESELTSGYKADKAKDSVGEKEWKAGVVQGKLTGTRKVILSRWDKPVRIVPESEVAQKIVEMFDGKEITMPSNVVTPSLRAELEKLGVPFVETDNQGKKLTDIAAMTTPIWSSKGTFANLAEAEKWADKNLKGKSKVNRYTGEKISIGANSISKMLSSKALKQSSSISAHLAALQSVLDFIETGIPAEIHADQEGRDFDVLRLYNAIEIDGKLYRVKSTVRKVRQGDKFYTYEVQEMELIEERWSSQKGEADNPRNPDSSINSITGAKLLKGVKKSNSKEEILPESKNLFSTKPTNIDRKAVEGLQILEATGMSFEREIKMVEDALWDETRHIENLKDRMKSNDSPLLEQRLLDAEARREVNEKQLEILRDVQRQLVDTTPIEPSTDMEPRTQFEYLSQLFTAHGVGKTRTGVRLTPQTLKRELGYSAADRKGISYIVSDSEGLTFDEVAEMVQQDSEAEYLFANMDTMEIKDVILDFISSMDSYSTIRDYVKSERAKEAKELQAQRDEAAHRIEEQYGMSLEQYNEMVIQQARDARDAWLKDEGNEEVKQEDAFDATTASVEEVVEHGKQKALEENAEAADTFMQRLRKLNGNINSLRMAAAAQREYDQSTMKIITDIAQELLEGGKLSDMTRGEVKRLMGIIKSATGKQDLTNDVNRLMDLMIQNQIRFARDRFNEFLKIRDKKVNKSGVETQGKLDIEGQQILDVVRKNIGLSLSEIDKRILDVGDGLFDKSDTVQKNTVNELVGLEIARRYTETIKESEAEEKALRDELTDVERDYQAKNLDKKTYQSFVREVENAIRDNKMQRVAAYESLISDIANMIAKSIQGATQFREAEKQRIENIQHFANSDLEGLRANAHRQEEGRFWNNGLMQTLTSPLATFEQWLKLFGSKSAEGKGYLYNHFMNAWNNANNNEYLGVKNAHAILDAKVQEIFKGKLKRWSDLFAFEKKGAEGDRTPTISIWDDGKMVEYKVTQGNLLYIYMVNKMTDGKMKLRRMGVSEETVDAIVKDIDPRFVQLADWIQDEFLPGLRDKYNAVHERLFGAPMATIDNYFPLKVLANARTQNEDVATPTTDRKPSTITGSIIKRTKNGLALDVTGADAFDVVLEHIQDMEHWAAFAEFNKDLNTLLSYTKFRNKVQNMSTAMGSGKEAWNSFRRTAEIAAGVYQSKPSNMADKTVMNMVKGLTTGKINFRYWTAIKQILSMPGFAPYANPIQMAKAAATPWVAWNWAAENLPSFQKRWLSRQAGNVRLQKNENDWKIWQNNVAEAITRWGMTPNAFVDAIACSIGAKAVYDTQYARYIKDGYSHEKADEKAKLDATTAFNATQQSSEGAFLSAVQSDRTFMAYALTVFRNNSFGMQREFVDALRHTKERMKKGYKEQSIEFMKKQMMRDGLTEEQAEKAAKRVYRRSAIKDWARIATFGFVMQFLWNLGSSAIYLLFGDDDDEKNEMIIDAAIRGAFGSLDGLGFGNIMTEGLTAAVYGDWKKFYPSLSPAGSDLDALWQGLKSDPIGEGVNALTNLLGQVFLGVNPQVITDQVMAIVDACDGDIETSKEVGIALLRYISAPQSQIDKLKEDEIDFTIDRGLDLTIEEFAKEYAEYKRMRGAGLANLLYSDEQARKVEDRYIKRFLKRAEELKRTRGNEEAKKYYEYLDTEYKEVTETINGLIRKMEKAALKGDYESMNAYNEQLEEYQKSEGYKRYVDFGAHAATIESLKKLMKDVDDLTRSDLEDQSLELRKELVESLNSYKKKP